MTATDYDASKAVPLRTSEAATRDFRYQHASGCTPAASIWAVLTAEVALKSLAYSAVDWLRSVGQEKMNLNHSHKDTQSGFQRTSSGTASGSESVPAVADLQ